MPHHPLRPYIASLWLILLVVCTAYAGVRLSEGGAFESNVLGLLPASNQEQSWQPKLLSSSSLQQRFVLLVGHGDASKGLVLARELRAQLQALPVVNLGGESDLWQQLAEFYRPYRHQLLTPAKRHQLETQDAKTLAQQVVAELYSPVRPLRPYPLAEDPFNLGGAWLQALFPQAAGFSPGEIPSILDAGQTWYVLAGKLSGNAFDPAVQRQISPLVEAFQRQHPDVEIHRSGFVFHAAAGTELAQREISTVGLGSMVGILLLVIGVFRSLPALLAIVFTLASSLVVALATSLAVFGQIHLVTLAFGSTLLGLAVDYCFHFLLNYRRVGNALVAGRLLARGLVLSVASTVLAYGLQLLSPFPGLQQFAVFVAVGLVAAGGAIAVLAFCYREAPGKHGQPRVFTAFFDPFYRGIARHRKLLFCALLVLIPMLAIVVKNAGFKDDLRLLNTSGSELLASEQQVRDLLGGLETQRYWIVTGADSQQVLQRTEQFVANLNRPVMALSQLVPSLVQQQRDYQLIRAKLYGSEGALKQLCLQLRTDCKDWLHQRRVFSPGLIPAHLPGAFGEYFPPLAYGDERHGVVFPYLSNSDELPADKGHARQDRVQWVDQVQQITGILADFRMEVSELFCAFLVFFALAALLLYRRRGLAVLSCVLVSLLAALALSASAGVSLFHILALLLVMGIAVDTVIFYLELGLDGDSWLAATLSMLTSVLAFGLLALSQVPLLHQFGSVVFYGLLCVWLLAPVLYRAAVPVNPNSLERTI